MPQEIERKFLVKRDLKAHAAESIQITQGYLSSVAERTVRVRISGEKAFLSIKGIGNESGISRFEWEKEITVEEAQSLLALCEPGIIDKTRYLIPANNGLVFEVDVFHGENEGLILAEIELFTEDTPFEKPEWLGKEVSGDKRYYNAYLSGKPFKNW